MNKTLIVRFLLEGGHTLDVVLNDDEAVKLVRDWESGKYGVHGRTHLGGTDLSGRNWSVALCRVQAVLTFQPPPQGQVGAVSSGLEQAKYPWSGRN